MRGQRTARHVTTPEVTGTTGAVVAVDVIRAFTTAAYALGSGARCIYLVGGVDEARAFVAAHPGALAMGEDHGLRPDGFAFANSPAQVAAADLEGRTIVQRTSAGTQGVVAARSADRLWAASLVVASATAAAVTASGLGAPTYVLTGWFADRRPTTPPTALKASASPTPAGFHRPGADDRLTAEHIEAVRLGLAPDPDAVARGVATSDEATRTLALGEGHVDPTDIDLATAVDRFPFAMEVTRDADGLRLGRVTP